MPYRCVFAPQTFRNLDMLCFHSTQKKKVSIIWSGAKQLGVKEVRRWHLRQDGISKQNKLTSKEKSRACQSLSVVFFISESLAFPCCFNLIWQWCWQIEEYLYFLVCSSTFCFHPSCFCKLCASTRKTAETILYYDLWVGIADKCLLHHGYLAHPLPLPNISIMCLSQRKNHLIFLDPFLYPVDMSVSNCVSQS